MATLASTLSSCFTGAWRQLALYQEANRQIAFHKGWIVLESLIIIAVVLLFNFYDSWTGIVLADEELARSLPIFISGTGRYLSLINGWLALALLLNAVLLSRGRWEPASRWAAFAIALTAAALLLAVVLNQPLVTLSPGWSTGQNAAAPVFNQARRLAAYLNIGVSLALIVAFLASTLACMQRFSLARLLQQDTAG